MKTVYPTLLLALIFNVGPMVNGIPTSSKPTRKPSESPTPKPTRLPSSVPTSRSPTPKPTRKPTLVPTSRSPTLKPTRLATTTPTSRNPTPKPSFNQTPNPTIPPTLMLTSKPSSYPSPLPTSLPTYSPTSKPTSAPSHNPTLSPTTSPIPKPSPAPSSLPTPLPTSSPSPKPTTPPSSNPTTSPTDIPTLKPTTVPTSEPTSFPTLIPTMTPLILPSTLPTLSPTYTPTANPTSIPTSTPTLSPTTEYPTSIPTSIPTNSQTIAPTLSSIIECPMSLGSSTFTQNGTLTFSIPESNENLCTLVQAAIDSETFKPIGRTYSGYAWEASSGEFSSLEWKCNATFCTVDLPPLPNGYVYKVTTFGPPETFRSDGVDEVARFLEQASFGPKLSDISKFNTNNLLKSFAEWIKEQQETIPLTSHRAMFRTRMNARMETATRNGAVTHPCQKGSIYRRFAFSIKDNQKYLSIKTVGDKRVITIDGFVRTVINGVISNSWFPSATWPDGSYQINSPPSTEKLGGDVYMYLPSQKGNADATFNGVRGNPTIQFDASIGANPNVLINLAAADAFPSDAVFFEKSNNKNQEIVLANDLSESICKSLKEPGNPISPVFAFYDNAYWIHDPRFKTFSNTVENPSPDGGGKVARETFNIVQFDRTAICANVERTFLNEGKCFLSNVPTACEAGKYEPNGGANRPNFYVSITPETIRGIYNVTGGGAEGTRYLYAIDGLRVKEDKSIGFPCERTGSRWTPINCTGAELQLDPTVQDIFSNLLYYNNDPNPYLRDVWNWWGTRCPESLFQMSGFEVKDKVEDKCWKNVHLDHLSVYDMTFWARLDGHPGNSLTRNPIKEFAAAGKPKLFFPSWHSMNRWADNEWNLGGYIGRLGDTVHYYNLGNDLRSQQLNEYFGFTPDDINYTDSKGVLVCGSPNEIKNEILLGGSQGRGAFDSYNENFVTTNQADFTKQKRIIWTHAALEAPDQLRQRVAWALSQILVVSPGAVSDGESRTEAMTAYYDIFIRHAFGSYRDILKEVSYSGIMGQMLTYYGSRSTAYTWRSSGNIEYADENYAREIMQLFTTGMFKLKNDGNVMVDSKGNPIMVYTNDDIVEYARAWTGFESRVHRGNIENIWHLNHVDPMKINMEFRDIFPKMGLDRKYIGDGYPLCSDLPDKHFLKVGALYRLLGSSSLPELMKDPKEWASDGKAKRLKLQANGPNSLFAKLCNASDPSQCNFNSVVILDTNLSCYGVECSLDTLRVVEVGNGIFYEYIRPPCVYHAFFKDAKTIVRRREWWDVSCADPRTLTASAACCNDGAYTGSWNDMFWGERVSFATAGQRCNQQLCNRWPRPECDAQKDPNLGNYCANNGHFWTKTSCVLRAKISLDGTVGIVHSPNEIEPQAISRHVQNDTKTYFRVDWSSKDAFKTITSNCASMPACAISIDDVCVCDVEVTDPQVYFTDGQMPTLEDVLLNLSIGAFNPATTGNYVITQLSNGVKMYTTDEGLSQNTVFEVIDSNGVRHFRKNVKSVVKIKGTSVSFRNPVHFISVSDAEVFQAEHETDAALDHYFYHPNTAPFLAIRFAQRFGISNPSPGYISRLASAFQKGSYTFHAGDSSTSFGSGRYGDIGAMVACLLLDQEARLTLLDADPAHGSFKEPLVKVIGLMRALDFKLSKAAPFVDFDVSVNLKIGQMAHALPNVFSFFSPFYTTGAVADASLVAPESQVMTGPRTIDFLNGLFSLIKYGLSSCLGGFGRSQWWTWYDCSRYTPGGENEGMLGKLTYSKKGSNSPNDIVDELATLLTAGRLSRSSRQVIQRIIASETNVTIATMKAQQLVVLTPEFHATNIVRQRDQVRPDPEVPKVSSKPYKAIVYVLLDGGMDSFNLLAPHTCNEVNGEGQTLLDQYYLERTTLAITADERSRVVDATGQPCSQFVVHQDLEIVHRLYKSGDLSFFANAGVLNVPVNKENYWQRTKTSLFGHNTMQEEAQKIDPFDNAPGSGILGRVCDVLKRKGFSPQPITVQDASVATVGVPGVGVDPLMISAYETTKFNPATSGESFDLKPYLRVLNNLTQSQGSLYGEVWSSRLVKALNDNEAILKAISTTQLYNTFPDTDYSSKLRAVSTLIASRKQRGTDRDVFYLSLGSWDHHSDMKRGLSSNFVQLNQALTTFYNEMNSQGVWDGVSLLITSDFSRTLTTNSGDGSDHAWGGNYFIMGGSVKGGKIHGSYPRDITASAPLNIGRGRIIPTLSWESIMNSVAQWMGADTEAELDYCMPNRKRTGAPLLSASEVFK